VPKPVGEENGAAAARLSSSGGEDPIAASTGSGVCGLGCAWLLLPLLRVMATFDRLSQQAVRSATGSHAAPDLCVAVRPAVLDAGARADVVEPFRSAESGRSGDEPRRAHAYSTSKLGIRCAASRVHRPSSSARTITLAVVRVTMGVAGDSG
jgi:hypothetical protein